ncbi:SDR family NAD(P)-dependent oxidoreductase [uncultured Erythrobacter sp.]|uniref:SDR family NAD(P)-dependent oxidoreductase n=1 Tax=uncultured Erythrobacter sp. TaxID=263913 RepID=UPI0026124524|nr:SDR family NAD(P)-dependent oxidoreductase [uncultured Erythrobacter sp.]
MDYAGKVVWITGASSGIGAALARDVARRGAHVVLSGRDETRLAEVAADCGETLILPFDVRDDDALADATAKATAWEGGVDIAFANAGVSQRSRALKTDMKVYRDIIDIDLTAQIAFSQSLIGHMAERGSGALAFISSIAGKVGVPMRTAYCAVKFGLAGYGDALRAELSQSGVSVHVIYPGSVATDVARNALVGDGSKRGSSDKVIDEGIPAPDAAKIMLDGMANGEREIIVAQGVEAGMGELRRTPEELLDQVAGMVAAGYMEKIEATE